MNISRRAFTVSLIASGLGAGAALKLLLHAPSKKDLILDTSKLLPHIDSAAAIGESYLELNQELSIDLILDDLFPDWQAGNVPDGADSIYPFLHNKIRTDFEENRVELVRKWHLSSTELKICALVAFTQRHDNNSPPVKTASPSRNTKVHQIS